MKHNQQSSSVENTALLCQQYMDMTYNRISSSLRSNQPESNTFSTTNGEILYHDLVTLLKLIKPDENDIFFDLGAGVGKIVLQVYLETPVKKAIGIEIMSDLHQRSLRVLDHVKADLPEAFPANRHIQFMSGSFFSIPFETATILMISCMCFTQAMMLRLGSIINHNSHVRTVISLRPILNLTQLKLKQIIRIQCSWDASLCYIYMRPKSKLPVDVAALSPYKNLIALENNLR